MGRRSIVLRVGLVIAVLGFVVAVLSIRATRPEAPVAAAPKPAPAKQPAVPPPAKPAVDEEMAPTPRSQTDAVKQGAALHDATLLGLIQNAKVAQQRGDTRTRDAMLEGLKKQPERSRELLAKEIASAKNFSVAYALETLMKELQ